MIRRRYYRNVAAAIRVLYQHR